MSPRVMPENRIPDIVKAACKVFSQRGYRLAQMEEIAKEANVSKDTIYYYFKSKIHLFYYLLENGVPEEGASVSPPEDSPPKTEHDLLQLLKERLEKLSRLANVEKFLAKNAEDVDVAAELEEILGEMWDLFESNRVQIVILEKSASEFPELAEVFDRYARRQVLHQLERYLSNRMRLGAIRPLNSIPATARFALESLAWFGFKQWGDRFSPPYPKPETLPDLVSIFADGLKK